MECGSCYLTDCYCCKYINFQTRYQMASDFAPYVSASGVGHPPLYIFTKVFDPNVLKLFGTRKRLFKSQIYIGESSTQEISTCVRGVPCERLRCTKWAHNMNRRFGADHPFFVETFENIYAVAISSYLQKCFESEKHDPTLESDDEIGDGSAFTLDTEAVTGDGSLFTIDTEQPLFMRTLGHEDGLAEQVYQIRVKLLSVRHDNKTGWLHVEKIREL